MFSFHEENELPTRWSMILREAAETSLGRGWPGLEESAGNRARLHVEAETRCETGLARLANLAEAVLQSSLGKCDCVKISSASSLPKQWPGRGHHTLQITLMPCGTALLVPLCNGGRIGFIPFREWYGSRTRNSQINSLELCH